VTDLSFLRENQQRDARLLVDAITAGQEITLSHSPIGIGKTSTMIGSLLQLTSSSSSVLISTQLQLIDQWKNMIRKYAPTSRVFVYGGTSPAQSFAEVCCSGRRKSLTSLQDMAILGPDRWHESVSERCFFITSHSNVSKLAAHLSEWFDVAIQDELSLSESAQRNQLTLLRSLSHKLVWFRNSEPSKNSGFPVQVTDISYRHNIADSARI
jgi:SNF2 family DNA or RNA helicase